MSELQASVPSREQLNRFCGLLDRPGCAMNEVHSIRRRTYLAGYGHYVPEIRIGIILMIAFCEIKGAWAHAEELRFRHGHPEPDEMEAAIEHWKRTGISYPTGGESK